MNVEDLLQKESLLEFYRSNANPTEHGRFLFSRMANFLQDLGLMERNKILIGSVQTLLISLELLALDIKSEYDHEWGHELIRSYKSNFIFIEI